MVCRSIFFLCCIASLWMARFTCGQEICNAMITQVTTSSITIECTGNATVGFLTYRKVDFSQPVQQNFNEKRVVLGNLGPGGKYEITVDSNWEEKKTFVVSLATCPRDWKGSHFSCFWKSKEVNMTTWEKASQLCNYLPSAHLADPRSSEENRFLLSVLPATHITFWIGVNDRQVEGTMTYSDSSPVTWNYDLSSPTNPEYAKATDCVAIHRTDSGDAIKWISADCTIAKYFVCQYVVSDSPRRLDITTGSQSTNVSWLRPPSLFGSMFDDYVISLVSETGLSRDLRVSSEENAITFESLEPGHLYWVSITAVHSAGNATGGTYPLSPFVTNPLSPSNLKLDKIAPTDARLTWIPPSQDYNNTYNEFLITFTTTENSPYLDGFVYDGTVTVDKSVASITLRELEPYRAYSVKLVARSSHVTINGNVSSVSATAGPLHFKTLISPVQSLFVPENNLSTNGFQLKWVSALGNVDGYNVTTTSTSGGERRHWSVSNGSTSVFTTPDMTPGQTYDATVVSLRDGSASGEVHLQQTTRPLPVRPLSIAIHHLSSDSINVSILHLAFDRSLLDGYNLTFTNTEHSETKRWRIVHNPNGVSLGTVRGLVPGRGYDLTVFTTSADVISVPVTRVNFVQMNPASPTGFHLLSRNETEILLTWDAAPGDFDSYALQCSSDEGPCPTPNEVLSPLVQQHLFTGLRPGALYNFALYIIRQTRNSDTIRLQDRTKPNTPDNVKSTDVTNSSIQVTWTSPSDVISGYLVQYSPIIESGVQVEGPVPVSGNMTFPAGPGNGTGHATMRADLLGLTAGITYHVTVATLSGEVRSSAVELRIPTEPNPIESLQLLDVGETWVLLSWQPGSGGFLKFGVAWTLDNGTAMTYSAFNNITITDLSPAFLTQTSVTKVTQDKSVGSTGLYVQTKPLPPRELNISNVNETSFVFTFSPPLSRHDYFAVQLLRLTSIARRGIELKLFVEERNVTSTSDIFTGLVPGATYIVAVEAVNNGTKSYELKQNVTLYPETPSALRTTLVRDDEVDVTWHPSGGAIGGYTVEYEPKDGVLYVQDQLAQPEAALGGLTPGRTYTIDVFALSENRKVQSRGSARLQVRTHETLPGPPLELMLTSENTGQISAKWAYPKDPNGIILHYRLLYKQVYPHPVVSFSVANTSTTGYVITNAEDGAVYQVKVAAVNFAGVGRFTGVKNVKVAASVPGAVYELSGKAVNSSSITVSWRHPRWPNGDITKYRLRVTDPDQHHLVEVNFRVKEIVNPYECILDNAPQEAVTSLLSPHISTTGDVSLPLPGLSFHNTSPKGDFTEDSPKLKEAVQPSTSDAITNSAGTSAGKSDTLSVDFDQPADTNEADYDDQSLDGKNLLDGSDRLLLRGRRALDVLTAIPEVTFERLCPVTYTVSDLEPYTRYNVRVRVWNTVGEGKMASTSVLTMQERPEGPPVDIHVDTTGSRQLVVAWSPPHEPNGEPLYTLKLFSQGHVLAKTFATNDTKLMLEDLNPFTSYAVAVMASTAAGDGPTSPYLTLCTEQDVPGAVYNLTAEMSGSNSIEIRWMSPSHPHGILRQYTVTVRDVAKNESVEYFAEAADVVSRKVPVGVKSTKLDTSVLGSLLQNYSVIPSKKIITNLRPFTVYEVRVTAVTDAGEGSVSLALVKTDQDKPTSRPTDLQYTNLTSTSVNITWNEPEIPNGIITSYTIYISSGQIFTNEVSQRFGIVEGLKKYTEYMVYVTASTVAGEGPSSYSISMLTDEDVPNSPPWNVTYQNITSSVVQLFWQPPLVPNGIVRSYTVYYRNETATYTETSNTTSAYLGWLRAYGEYDVTISASTSKGESAIRSEPLKIRTMEGQPTTPPYNLSYENITPRSIRVIWKEPVVPNGIVQYYNVTLAPLDQERLQNRSFRTIDHEPRIVIGELSPFSEYLVSVRANTKYGDGEQESASMLIQTLQDVPETPPMSSSYTNLTSSSVEVTWYPPSVPNGIISTYTVRYQARDDRPSSPDQLETITVSGNTTRLVVTGMRKYSPYTFNISASTLTGEGPALGLLVHTDEDEPSSPPDSITYQQISSTAILLRWQPPLEPNGIILGYRVYYSNKDEVNEVVSLSPQVNLTGLQKYGKYDVYVTSYTRVGDGNQRSDPTTFETLEDAPSDPPHSVAVLAVTSTSVNVTWQPPTMPNGLVQFYTIYYKANTSDTKFKEVAPHPRAYLLTELKKYTWYEVWITASTALGDGGHRSASVNVRTLEDTPGAPENVSCNVVDHQQIEVTWREPSEPNGVLGPYFVLVTSPVGSDVLETGRNASLSWILGVDVTSHVVRGLLSYTLYTFQVASSTGVGNGELGVCIARTDESVPSQPVNVTVVAVHPTTVELTWNEPKVPNGIILGYNVSAVGSGSDAVTETVPISSSTPTVRHVLSNLLKYSKYFVQVAARTSMGFGPRSDGVFLNTAAGVPDFAVQSLTVIPVNSTTLQVSWTAHMPLTGPTYFRVVTRKTSKSEVVDMQAEVLSESTIISNLVPYTTYDVTVTPLVVGVAADGPTASGRSTTLEDIPATPVSSLRHENRSSTSVYLMWDPPSRPNGVISQYTVSVAQQQRFIDVPGDETSLLLSDLDKFTIYNITVTSRTHVGIGPSTSISLQTMQDVPSGPARNIQTILNARSAKITWEPPSEPNGIIANYTLLYDTEGFDQKTVVVNETFAELSDLKPFSQYKLNVHTSTQAGMGPSNFTTFVTEQDVPSAPTDLNCTATTEHDVSVAWKKPFEENGIILNYMVSHRIAGASEQGGPDNVSANVFALALQQLSPFTEYEIEVAASTMVGVGPSATCTVRTMESYPLAPESIYVQETNDTSIKLGWKMPLVINGELTNFVLTFAPPDSCSLNGGLLDSTNDIASNAQTCVVNVEKQINFYRLNGLQKHTTYRVTVAASTSKGTGPSAVPPVVQRTDVGEPDHPPRNVRAMVLSSTSINVTWSEPEVMAGKTTYKVRVINTDTMEMTESPQLESTARGHMIKDLHEDSTYNVTVAAITSKGELESLSVSVDTHEDVPSDFPDDVSVATVIGNSTAAKVLFKPPLDPNGQLIQYTIQYRLKDSQDFSEAVVEVVDLSVPTTDNEAYSWPVAGLLGGRAYTFRVRAATKVGPGPWSLWTDPITLPILAPRVPDQAPGAAISEDPQTGTSVPVVSSVTITVKSPCVFSDVNGPLASLSVVVSEDGADLNKEPTDWYNARSLKPIPPYKVIVTTDVSGYCGFGQQNGLSTKSSRRRRSIPRNDKNFVIGSDESCEDAKKPYCNGPLKSNTPYRFKYRAETIDGAITDTRYSEVVQTDSSFLESHLTLIIGISAAVAIFLLILVVTIVLLRRRMTKKRSSQSESDVLDITGLSASKRSGPIEEKFGECKSPITEVEGRSNMAFTLETGHEGKVREGAISRPVEKLDFADHVTRMTMRKNKGFSCEFDDIQGLDIAGRTMAAEKSYNRTKNRHAKLVPFDHSRVKLLSIPAIDGSDYINASFIPGPQSAEHFIATQSPLEHTRKDFWRMVWETGASTIVMLCSGAEEGKKRGFDYWPRKQTEYYGNLAVQLMQEDVELEWTIRQFSLAMRGKLRQITQFHLMAWPVHEQSDNAQTVLRFVQTVRANRTAGSIPIVVMCSSGSSRSGVFIALDRMLETLAMSSKVDVFGAVAALRRYRPYMVQSLDEYILIHRCIWEAVQQRVSEEKQVARQPTGDGLEETVF